MQLHHFTANQQASASSINGNVALTCLQALAPHWSNAVTKKSVPQRTIQSSVLLQHKGHVLLQNSLYNALMMGCV